MKRINPIFYLAFCILLAISHSSIAEDYEEDICSEEGVTLVPHPIYCAFFYICDIGQPELMECPPGLYFNPSRLTCDFEENVPNCDGGTHAPLPGSTTTTKPTTTTLTPETEPTQRTTTEPSVGSTTWTPKTTTTTVRSTSPGEPELECPSESESIFMPYPHDCVRFYYCRSGVLIDVRSCTGGLWFNFSKQACMTPWEEQCPN